MSIIGFTILILSFVTSQIFQIKASKFVKPDYGSRLFRKIMWWPFYYSSEAYLKAEGIKYKNISIVLSVAGLFIFILFTSLRVY